MVIALIVVGVVAFLLIDTYVLVKVLGSSSKKNVGAYGSIEIPGSTQMSLPAGKVKLNYVEARKARSDEDTIYFDRPADMQVTVTPSDGGAPLELDAPGWKGMGSSKSTKKGFSRDLHGTVEVVTPGLYTIECTGTTAPDAVQPLLMIGK